jgi:predicted nucleotidyltransferase
MARKILPMAASVVVFGSFARGEAEAASDLDIVVVRPQGIAADDEGWTDALSRWHESARRVVGNPVNLLELPYEGIRIAKQNDALWRSIEHDGVVLIGGRLVVHRGRVHLGDDPDVLTRKSG